MNQSEVNVNQRGVTLFNSDSLWFTLIHVGSRWFTVIPLLLLLCVDSVVIAATTTIAAWQRGGGGSGASVARPDRRLEARRGARVAARMDPGTPRGRREGPGDAPRG